MLRLKNQGDRVSCGACSYAILLSGLNIFISEKQACDECKTTINGTACLNVLNALKKRKIDCYFVELNISFKEYERWLYLNSINRILYLSYLGKNKGKKQGRPSEDNHAVCCCNGFIYDSNENEPLPIETFTNKYNYKFIIKDMILVEIPKELQEKAKFDKGIDIE